jgi:hypothetical protein
MNGGILSNGNVSAAPASIASSPTAPPAGSSWRPAVPPIITPGG